MSRHTPARASLFLGAALAALVVAGCSSSDSTPTGGSTTPNSIGYSAAQRLWTAGYTDPSAIRMQQGLYLMYLNRQGQGGGTYVLQSPDALTWTERTGVIFAGISEGRALRTATGVRFYYPNQTASSGQPAGIASSFATDGVTFTADAGVRVSPRAGYSLGRVTVFQISDNHYRMFFEEYELASGAQKRGVIWGASSSDGLTWTRDVSATIEPQEFVEGIAPYPQATNPFVVFWDGVYTMFYDSHSSVYAAGSYDAVNWTKTGTTGIIGTDVDGVILPNGALRIFFGRFTEATGDEIYTAVLTK